MKTKKDVMAFLRFHANNKIVLQMKYFGIETPKAFGVKAPLIRSLAKEIGTNHTLALSLWKTKFLEARALAALVADPEQVTEKLMESWVSDFDSWAICDACCGELFAYSPLAVSKAYEWSKRKNEFEKRAGFVMMVELSIHRKEFDDSIFLPFFKIIIRESTDERNFVRKAVNWALRQIGKHNKRLHTEAMKCAVQLSRSNHPTARWIGVDAIKDLSSAATKRRFERQAAKQKRSLKHTL